MLYAFSWDIQYPDNRASSNATTVGHKFSFDRAHAQRNSFDSHARRLKTPVINIDTLCFIVGHAISPNRSTFARFAVAERHAKGIQGSFYPASITVHNFPSSRRENVNVSFKGGSSLF